MFIYIYTQTFLRHIRDIGHMNWRHTCIEFYFLGELSYTMSMSNIFLVHKDYRKHYAVDLHVSQAMDNPRM